MQSLQIVIRIGEKQCKRADYKEVLKIASQCHCFMNDLELLRNKEFHLEKGQFTEENVELFLDIASGKETFDKIPPLEDESQRDVGIALWRLAHRFQFDKLEELTKEFILNDEKGAYTLHSRIMDGKLEGDLDTQTPLQLSALLKMATEVNPGMRSGHIQEMLSSLLYKKIMADPSYSILIPFIELSTLSTSEIENLYKIQPSSESLGQAEQADITELIRESSESLKELAEKSEKEIEQQISDFLSKENQEAREQMKQVFDSVHASLNTEAMTKNMRTDVQKLDDVLNQMDETIHEADTKLDELNENMSEVQTSKHQVMEQFDADKGKLESARATARDMLGNVSTQKWNDYGPIFRHGSDSKDPLFTVADLRINGKQPPAEMTRSFDELFAILTETAKTASVWCSPCSQDVSVYPSIEVWFRTPVIIDAYILQSSGRKKSTKIPIRRDPYDSPYMREWKLEGLDESDNWNLLDARFAPYDLKDSYHSYKCAFVGSKYKAIRLQMTAVNGAGGRQMWLTAFKIYGSVVPRESLPAPQQQY